MFKKFMLYLTAVTMLLTMLIPGIGAFAAMTDPVSGTNYDYIRGGVIVTEGSYTAASGGNAQFGFVSHKSSSSTNEYNKYMKISGITVSNVKNSSGNSTTLCTLTENDEYFFTVVYTHLTGAGIFYGEYDLYINGVMVVSNQRDYAHGRNHYIDDIECTGITPTPSPAFVSSDASATYDMAPYSAVITSSSNSIVLGGTDKKSNIVFGGFTAELLSEMTGAEFLEDVTAPTGATVSFKRNEATIGSDVTLQAGDIVSITSQNGKVTNEYVISLNLPAVTSDVYTISSEKVISDVYEYTSVSTFKDYLNVEEGWDIALKNGESEVTEGIVTEDMTLCATNAEGKVQNYTIDILGRTTQSASSGSITKDLPKSLSRNSAFRGNLVIELDSKVVNKYYTGPADKSAFYVTAGSSSVKLGMYKNIWSGDITTDLALNDSLSLVFVVKGNDNKVDYYVNGDYTGTCSMSTIYSATWKTWRVAGNTDASFYMVEDLDAYLAAKKVNKINTATTGKVSVNFAGADADTLYLAVYNGNELENLYVAKLTDHNFNSNVLSIPNDVTGKTVKAFLWTDDLYPLDYVTIQQ